MSGLGSRLFSGLCCRTNSGGCLSGWIGWLSSRLFCR